MNDIKSRIYNDVKAVRPYDMLEKKHIQDTLAWIRSGLPLFRIQRPDVPPKHLVSYFVLVDHTHKSVLLCDHIKAQLWLPSGGHVENNEHPKETVIRESVEELGKEAVFLRNNDRPFFITVTETGGLIPGHTDVSLWYLLAGSKHDFINFEKREFNDIAWFSVKEITEIDAIIFDPHMKRFTQKLTEYLSW
jgi:8-oxo-dGTP diphosphatase